MGMTATLATLYIAKARRANAIEALVHERTAELSLANHELDQSRGTLASLLEACPDAINGKDAHGRWTFANRAFLELAGIHEHFPYKGLKDADILQRAAPTNPRFLEARSQLDHELLGSGQPVRREMTIDAPDTTRRYLDIHMLPVRGSDGSTAGLVAVHNDITELRRRIIALQRSRERVKLLVENTATAIVEWDESFRVIHWNPAAARMFGYDWDDVRQKPVDFFASPDDTANATLSLASCLKERETTIPQIFRHRTKRGQPLICEWQNTPLVGEDGHPLGVTSFIYDVTERTKAESALRKRDGILRGLAGSAAGFLNADSWEPEAGELLRHLVDSLALSRVHLVHVASTIDGPAPSTVFEWLNPYGDTAALATPDGPDPHQKLCEDGLCKSLLESGRCSVPSPASRRNGPPRLPARAPAPSCCFRSASRASIGGSSASTTASPSANGPPTRSMPCASSPPCSPEPSPGRP